jgi:tetratricopeptide (TPR) repeat protein
LKARRGQIVSKNKGKFGRAKATAVPETDEFISGIDRLMRALKPHALRLGIFLGVIVVVVVGYTTWRWWQDRKQTAATEIYFRAFALNQVPVRAADTDAAGKPGEDADKPEPPAGKGPDPRGIPAEFATADDRARAVLAALEELSAEYGSTSVARQGVLLQAETLYQLARYREAADRYREYAESGGPVELVLSAREGLAYSLEAQAVAEKDAKARDAGLEQALKAFQDMQLQSDGPRRDESLYHQARVQSELGRKEDARKTLERILTDYPDSALKQDVEMRLPLLRGAPAAAAPAAAPATPPTPAQ